MGPRPLPPQYSPPMTSTTLLTPDYLFLGMATYPTTCIYIMGMICGTLGVYCRLHVVLGVIYRSQAGRGDPTSDNQKK